MSGILGIWHRDGRPAERAELARLAATIRHRGGDAEGVSIAGVAGLAATLNRVVPESDNETQPVVVDGDDGDAATLVFDGRLDNRDDLVRALESDAAVSRDSPDSILALAAYRRFGDDFPARLGGDFALAVFDSRRRQLLLARDAVGVRPLYFHATPRLFLFASEIKALLAHPDVPFRPDEGALADFLFTRFAEQPPTERTFFEDISSVAPGHTVIAGPSGVRTERYWDFDPTRSIRFAAVGDYTDAFREHFHRAVRRRLRSTRPVAISVSGGLDSSAIYCTALAIARDDRLVRPIGVSQTFPDGSPSDEKQFLVEIERASGGRIVRLHDLPIGIIDACRDAIWHGEMPYLDTLWNATRTQMSAIRQMGAGVLLTGHWGDQFLCDDAYLVDLWRRGDRRKALRHAATFARWMGVPARAFRRRLLGRLLKYHVPTVMTAVRKARGWLGRRPGRHAWAAERFATLARRRRRSRRRLAGASAHASAIYAEVRSQYAVSCMERNDKIAAMHGLDAAYPFLDRDLIAFLMAIPGEVLSRDGVPKGLLRDALAGVLPDAITRRASKADFTARVNAGIVQERARIIADIRDGGQATERHYVSAGGLDALATSAIVVDAPTAVSGWAIADLFALELWLQEFVGATHRDHTRRIVDHAHAI